jgi:hypothetical protein
MGVRNTCSDDFVETAQSRRSGLSCGSDEFFGFQVPSVVLLVVLVVADPLCRGFLPSVSPLYGHLRWQGVGHVYCNALRSDGLESHSTATCGAGVPLWPQ